jgi:hypothetical protein
MPKRGSDADSRVFFDEPVSLRVSRLRATGAIRLEDRHGVISFGDKQKLIGVTHTVFKNCGAWNYFMTTMGVHWRVTSISLGAKDGRSNASPPET